MPKKRNTGLPKIKQLPSGAYHALVYSHTDADGKRHYESFTGYDYNQVLLDVANFKADKKRDRIDRAQKKLTLGEAMQQYIEAKSAVLSPSTVSTYHDMQRSIFADIRDIPLSDITQDMIQRAVNREALNHSPKTVRNYHGFLSSVMQMYRPDFVLHTTLPQKIKNEIVIPTEEEVKRLLVASRGTPMEIPVLLAACCGMRRSEIAALTWDDIDFCRNIIRVKKALVADEKNALVEKTTKTTASTRSIRMIPLVSDTLRRYKDDHPCDGYITISPDNITHRFEHLLHQAGCPRYRFHDLRHYTVSVMLALNVPKNYIADYVGHSTENMIEQVYGHIMASKKTTVEDQLQDYFQTVLE